MKDVISRQSIEELQKSVSKIESDMSYHTKEPLMWVAAYGFPCPRARLSAGEIIDRFHELYELLGVERKTIQRSTKLVKKGQKS